MSNEDHELEIGGGFFEARLPGDRDPSSIWSLKEDQESGHPDRQRYTLNWDTLNRSAEESDGNDGSQLETLLKIREKLKEYQEAMMERPSMGNVYLDGPDRNIWQNPDFDDLASLAPWSPESKFTNRYTVALVQFYNRIIGRHVHATEARTYSNNTIRYTDEGIFRILKTLAAIAASLLPVAGIAVLYTIKTMPGRIGAISGFTALFSFSLSFITSASLHHIFSATAA
ncbi:hypothetical protein B0T14DRAFT_605685 [Immersiella caudata]|uniref:DUF6594 domain-containing protein n=1 Tax=Immersiella caudata TaxID=314043 RepID=A0AA39WLL7_9PEZI|nr:hypothetical protein B0T14DRAFT_605685 [Immersiella caudata]